MRERLRGDLLVGPLVVVEGVHINLIAGAREEELLALVDCERSQESYTRLRIERGYVRP